MRVPARADRWRSRCILVGFWAAFALYPLPGPGFDYTQVGVPANWPHLYSGFLAHFNKNSNLSWAFDVWFLNLFPREAPFRFNEGGWSTLSFIPTLATMMLGMWCGEWLKSARSTAEKLQGLVVAGVALTIAGLLFQWLHICPIVKRIWTSSYTLYSGGLVILMLAGFYAAIEWKGWRRWSFPLLVIGANSIAIYVMSWTIEHFVKGALAAPSRRGAVCDPRDSVSAGPAGRRGPAGFLVDSLLDVPAQDLPANLTPAAVGLSAHRRLAMSPRPDPSGLITDRSLSQPTFTRREVLALTAAAFLPDLQAVPKRTKKVIVAGAGIGGLSCAWELVRRGHDVTVLEASARTGGHVFTVRDGLDDGLYADGGAEHFTQPGYERYWEYVREFDLPHVYIPRREHLLRWIGGTMYTPRDAGRSAGARRSSA